MKRPPIIIDHKNPRWRQVVEYAFGVIREMAEAGSITIRIDDVIRSLDQNAKMWPMLHDFAEHVRWPVNGTMDFLEPEDWKAILTAAFQREARMAPGLRGGFVMLGARTSKFSRREMSDFITFLYAEGNERGVQWSEKSREMVVRYGAERLAA